MIYPSKSPGKGKVAFIFPGQGSQAVGMGLELYQHSPAAREFFEEKKKPSSTPALPSVATAGEAVAQEGARQP